VKDQRIYLKHISEAIEDIGQYTAAGKGTFLESRMRQDAVIRKLEVIGEAAKHLSLGIKESRPDVPWREISRIADKMLHEYLGVNLETVWILVERDLPVLRKTVEEMFEGQ
jgi:uncharacterized protein with HEPN domain